LYETFIQQQNEKLDTYKNVVSWPLASNNISRVYYDNIDEDITHIDYNGIIIISEYWNSAWW